MKMYIFLLTVNFEALLAAVVRSSFKPRFTLVVRMEDFRMRMNVEQTKVWDKH